MTEDDLKEIVCSVSRMDRSTVTSSTPLAGMLASSLGRARLDAAVRSKFGISSPAVYRAATFGELCVGIGVSASGDGSSTKVAAPPRAASAAVSGIRIGIDIESISALPGVPDFWEDEFYRETFARSEIAYALMQNDPRASLAAIWCAKEALRKADPSLADIEWQRMVVVHDGDGRPELRVDGQPAGGALSLTHTEQIAFAAFVNAPPVSPAPLVHTPVGVPTPIPVPARTGVLSLSLALLALAVSVLTLLLLFFHR